MVKVYLVGKPLLLHGVGNEIKELRVKIVLVIERSQAVVIIVAEAYLLLNMRLRLFILPQCCSVCRIFVPQTH